MQAISFDSSTGQSPHPLPENLEEGIVKHPKNESFIESPAFVVLFLAIFVVLGSIVGVILAL